MNKSAIEQRFLFHANAVALAAHIRRKDEFFVNAVASTCLPVTGGIGTAVEAGKDFRGMISYDAASTSVFGDFTDRNRATEYTYGNHGDNLLPTVTTVEGKIEGLRIEIGGRRVKARMMEATMESLHDRKSAPQFHKLVTTFEAITVDDVELQVINHSQIFEQYDTKEKLCQAYKKDSNFREAHAEHFFSAGCRTTDWLGRPIMPETNGIIVGTVVTRMQWTGPAPKGAVISGNRVTIDNFGSIYFGEMVMEEGFRRATLLRFQLGSPDGGEGSAVDIQSNGTGWPPKVGGDG